MAKYITAAGDTWDGIAYQLFGDEAYMQDLINLNPEYVGVFMFDADVVLNVPELDEDELDEALPEWRTMTDEDMDAEEESSVDYYSDEEAEDDESGDYPEEDEGNE